MKKIYTVFFKIHVLFFLFGLFISNQLLASNHMVSLNTRLELIQPTSGEEWKLFVETNEISIYYTVVKDNPCMSYKLKIVNHTNNKKILSFAIAGKAMPNCKKTKTEDLFHFRNINLNANETIIGSEQISDLMIPSTLENLSLEVQLQNVNLQNQ